MIHVAPCSCELHVRIRELEAELRNREKLPPTRHTHKYIVQRDAAIARAEKAEKELALAEATERNHEVQFASQGDRLREWMARAEKAEEQNALLKDQYLKDKARIAKAIAALDVEHQEVIEQKARVTELEHALDIAEGIVKAREREAD